MGDTVSEADTSVADAVDTELEQPEVQTDEKESQVIEKKDIESSEELVQVRTAQFNEKEQDTTWQDAKRSWKEDNPNETLKEYKEKFINGEIDSLPWEDYIPDESKKKTYIMKQGNQQIRKTTE